MKKKFLKKIVLCGVSLMITPSVLLAKKEVFDTDVRDKQEALKGKANAAQLEEQIQNYEQNVTNLLKLKQDVYDEVKKRLPTADQGNASLIKDILRHEPTFVQFIDFVGDYNKNISKEISQLRDQAKAGTLTNQNLLEFASIVGTTVTTISQFVHSNLIPKIKEKNPAFIVTGLSQKYHFKCPASLTKDQWKKIRDKPSSSIILNNKSFTLYKGAENFPLSAQVLSWKKLASPEAFVGALYDDQRSSFQCHYMYKSSTTYKPYDIFIEHKL